MASNTGCRRHLLRVLIIKFHLSRKMPQKYARGNMSIFNGNLRDGSLRPNPLHISPNQLQFLLQPLIATVEVV